MVQVDYLKVLSETGIDVDRPLFRSLSEDAKFQVTDDVLTGMMKFITDKYNALDFGEIERSAGDIEKFKYKDMLYENIETLSSIYSNASDTGATRYLEVCTAVRNVLNFLREYRNEFRTQYQAGNGMIQLLYTSLVAGCIYSVGILVSNTIRFVTTEQETDCQVLYDEIPGTIKHVHIKNILAASNDLATYEKLLRTYGQRGTQQAMHESISAGAVAAVVLGIGAVIMLIPRVLVMIREIIYSVYYTRVKVADMIAVQVDLINTNIESLEAGRGNKKVIAKQKRIVDKLVKWQNRIAVKVDTVNTMVAMQKKRENTSMRIEQNSPIMMDPGALAAGDLLL
ncbi:hypothetical protein [uncultured Duncaniella sp.]|uniref:hypothetical protein n=1 Tax=uncultured Duncaniella sp. TaxID=2768039 RepID=UPI002614D715|nr:hypothetical protein [uncultured Duncaniella sp.]